MGENKERPAVLFGRRIANLLAVKSLMTLALTATFVALAASGVITGDKYYDIFLMVVSFYFGTQTKKD